MARKKKKIADVDVDELKNKLWQHIMENGGDLDAAFDSFNSMRIELDKKLSEYARGRTVEVKAFKLSLQGVKELREYMDGNFVNDSDEKSLMAALANVVDQEDPQKRFEYHESEMQRHADAAAALQKELSSL